MSLGLMSEHRELRFEETFEDGDRCSRLNKPRIKESVRNIERREPGIIRGRQGREGGGGPSGGGFDSFGRGSNKFVDLLTRPVLT